MANNFDNKLQNFNNKYSIALTGKKLKENIDKIYAIDFNYGKNDLTKVYQLGYRKSLLDAYLQATSQRLFYQEVFAVKSADFNLQEFINDFEEVFAEYNDLIKENVKNAGEHLNREKYNGNTKKDLHNFLIEKVKEKNATLIEFWQSAFLNGDLDTNKIIYYANDTKTKLLEAKSIQLDNKFLNSSIKLRDFEHYQEEFSQFKTIVATKEAITNIRQSRGFFWKLFHPIQNYRENKALEVATNAYNEVANAGYPVQEMLDRLNGEKVFDRQVGQVFKDAQQVNEKEPQVIKEEKAVKVGDIFDKKFTQEILQSKESKDKFISDTKEIFSKSTFKATIKFLFTANGGSYDRLMDKAKDINSTFDFISDKEEAIKQCSKEMFAFCYDVVKNLGYDTKLTEGIVATQKLTDYMLKNYGPTALAPQQYGNLNIEPILNQDIEGVKKLLGSLDLDEDACEDCIQDARKIYNQDLDRESIQVVEVMEKGNVEISQPISQIDNPVVVPEVK